MHLQLQDEREGEKKGKDKSMEESMCCACVHMRAQKPNKSGHEYECNHTIEYTTLTTHRDIGWACRELGASNWQSSREEGTDCPDKVFLAQYEPGHKAGAGPLATQT